MKLRKTKKNEYFVGIPKDIKQHLKWRDDAKLILIARNGKLQIVEADNDN